MAVASIDIELMGTLVRQMEQARTGLSASRSRLVGILDSVQVDSSPPAPLTGVAAWVEGQIPGLRRRLAMAVAIEAATPGIQRLVAIDESLLVTVPPVQAAADARRAADLMKGIDDGAVSDELLGLLETYAADPYFAHELAQRVSPQDAGDIVLGMSRDRGAMMSLMPDAGQIKDYDDRYTRLLDGLGQSLGLATHATGVLALPAGYAKSWSDAVTAPMPPDGGEGRYGMASALGLVIQHGSWSTPFLTEVGNAVYDEERRAGEGGRRVWEPRAYISGSAYVGAVAPGGSYAYDPLASTLSAMGRNPDAATSFFTTGGRTTVSVEGGDVDVAERLKYLLTGRRWPVDDAAGAKAAIVASITPSLGASTLGTTVATEVRAVLTFREAEMKAREDDGGNWFSDIGHGVLDGLGLIPVVGEPADAVNGVWYLAQGNTVDAALSAGALVPFAGWGATGGKWVRHGVEFGDEFVDGVRAVNNIGDLAAAARGIDEVTGLPRYAEDIALLTDEAAVAADATRTSRMPQWLKDRLETGRQFNRDNWSRYDANEVYLANGKILDSYNHGSEIVSRKLTQLSEVQPGTARQYLNEIGRKYSPGEVIADTPTNRRQFPPDLIGKPLDGAKILEVPVQHRDVPPELLERARKLLITIRDVAGHEYN